VSSSPDPAPAGPPSTGREPPDELFTALADGTRRRILRAVADQGPVTATALAEAMPVSRQAVAKHLALLRTAGLVVAERSGRETQFTVASEPLGDLARWAEVAGRRWDDRLDRLRRRFG
jgi:ArsR family transcriptional regulator, cadmium/lead-responsive transcriptional repressor